MPSAARFPSSFLNLPLNTTIYFELPDATQAGGAEFLFQAAKVGCGLIQQNGRVNQRALQEEHLIEALSRACRADLRAAGWTAAGMGRSQQPSLMTKAVCAESIYLHRSPALPTGGGARHS